MNTEMTAKSDMSDRRVTLNMLTEEQRIVNSIRRVDISKNRFVMN